jgi:phosphatidate phosphatase LPIN
VRFGNAQSFLRGREAKVVTVTVNGTLSELTMRLGSNGEAYFADGVDDFDEDDEDDDDDDVELEGGDADEAGAIAALSALRLETPPKTRPSTSNVDEEDGRCKLSEAEIEAALNVLQGAGMTVLPAVELSLCGGKVEEFDKHLVTLERFKANPSLGGHSGLVVRPRRSSGAPPPKALPWSAAAPHVLAHIAFGTPLPSNWKLTSSARVNAPASPMGSALGGSVGLDALKSPRRGRRVRRVQLTQDEVMSLDLKPGINTITFAFNSRVWGLQEVSAFVYLWDWNIKLVISDVDGTITKSDVLGHLAPMVGKDWSHDGVASLYSNITDNGYKMMFLTSRAISHASGTRKYLSSLRQGDKTLAQGPVMCAPDPLSKALFREVVTRNPQRFKIRCLQDIRNLFPPGWNPFHAGFGNRDTDVESYLAVGVPQHRVFTINPKGEVVCETTKRVKQYTLSEVNELAHEMFPPIEDTCPVTGSVAEEQFNDFNHWKNPVDADFGTPI